MARPAYQWSMAAAAMPPQRPRVVMSTPTAGIRRTWLVKPLLKAKPFSAGVKLMRMVVCLSPKVWLVGEKRRRRPCRYWAPVLIPVSSGHSGQVPRRAVGRVDESGPVAPERQGQPVGHSVDDDLQARPGHPGRGGDVRHPVTGLVVAVHRRAGGPERLDRAGLPGGESDRGRAGERHASAREDDRALHRDLDGAAV